MVCLLFITTVIFRLGKYAGLRNGSSNSSNSSSSSSSGSYSTVRVVVSVLVVV